MKLIAKVEEQGVRAARKGLGVELGLFRGRFGAHAPGCGACCGFRSQAAIEELHFKIHDDGFVKSKRKPAEPA